MQCKMTGNWWDSLTQGVESLSTSTARTAQALTPLISPGIPAKVTPTDVEKTPGWLLPAILGGAGLVLVMVLAGGKK